MAYPSHGHISYSPPDMAGADVFEGMRHWADKATWLSGQPWPGFDLLKAWYFSNFSRCLPLLDTN